jgi:hypothetical protein
MLRGRRPVFLSLDRPDARVCLEKESQLPERFGFQAAILRNVRRAMEVKFGWH